MSKGWINPQSQRHTSADEDKFPAFDDTLTTGIEDTVRNLRVIQDRPHAPRESDESQRWQFKAVNDLTTEVAKLRKELGHVVRTLDKKASLMAQAKFEEALSARIEARLTTIRNIAMWAVGILFVVVGIVKVAHADGSIT